MKIVSGIILIFRIRSCEFVWISWRIHQFHLCFIYMNQLENMYQFHFLFIHVNQLKKSISFTCVSFMWISWRKYCFHSCFIRMNLLKETSVSFVLHIYVNKLKNVSVSLVLHSYELIEKSISFTFASTQGSLAVSKCSFSGMNSHHSLVYRRGSVFNELHSNTLNVSCISSHNPCSDNINNDIWLQEVLKPLQRLSHIGFPHIPTRSIYTSAVTHI